MWLTASVSGVNAGVGGKQGNKGKSTQMEGVGGDSMHKQGLTRIFVQNNPPCWLSALGLLAATMCQTCPGKSSKTKRS